MISSSRSRNQAYQPVPRLVKNPFSDIHCWESKWKRPQIYTIDVSFRGRHYMKHWYPGRKFRDELKLQVEMCMADIFGHKPFNTSLDYIRSETRLKMEHNSKHTISLRSMSKPQSLRIHWYDRWYNKHTFWGKWFIYSHIHGPTRTPESWLLHYIGNKYPVVLCDFHPEDINQSMFR